MLTSLFTFCNNLGKLFQLYWRYKSRNKNRKSRITQEVIDLVEQMAQENRLWSAERIRGELLKHRHAHVKWFAPRLFASRLLTLTFPEFVQQRNKPPTEC